MRDYEDVTGLLQQAAAGNRSAMDRVVSIVYDELRAIAHRQRRAEGRDHTLGTTGIVHEAYLKLVGWDRIKWQNRAQFYAIAARAMRQILTDYAKGRLAAKRGGGAEHVALEERLVVASGRTEELILLDLSLQELEAMDERQARVVECRFFGGLSVDETAEALGVSPATVKRDWTLARAWLNQQLAPEASDR